MSKYETETADADYKAGHYAGYHEGLAMGHAKLADLLAAAEAAERFIRGSDAMDRPWTALAVANKLTAAIARARGAMKYASRARGKE